MLNDNEISKCMTNLKIKGHQINEFQNKSALYGVFKNSENNLKLLRNRIKEIRSQSTSPTNELGFNERLYHMNLMERNPCKEPSRFKRITRNINKYSHKLTNANKIVLPHFAEIPSVPKFQECVSENKRNPFEHSFIKFLKSRKNTEDSIHHNKEEQKIHLIGRDRENCYSDNKEHDSDKVSVECIPIKTVNNKLNRKEQNIIKQQAVYSDI